MPDNKQHAFELIQRLAPEQLSAVVHLLEVLVDPVAASIRNAAIEEEEITPEMAEELDRARTSTDPAVDASHEEILREFGLTPRS